MIKFEITKRDITSILGVSSPKIDKSYNGISTIDNPENHSVIFIKKINKKQSAIISSLEDCLIITQEKDDFDYDILTVENARFSMSKVLNYISNEMNIDKTNISKHAFVHPKASIGKNVRIEAFAFVDDSVEIGDNVIIRQGAKILKNSVIGESSIIRENSVVGGQGFGVEKNKFGNNLKIAHHGGVIIGKHVEIGALNTIVSGTIDSTIIEDYTKIDDHVHIAHNCRIGKNSIITAGVIFSGSVKIGSNVWIGPNSTIKNSIEINAENLIGIGTVITKSIANQNNTYAGVPGKEFGDFINEKKAIRFLVKNLENIKNKLIDIE